MPAQRPLSRVDQALSERLKATGRNVEPRQLERWRVDGGVIERSSSPAAFEQACAVHDLLDSGLDLDEVAIVQFMRGRYVNTEKLKRALAGQLMSALGPPSGASDWRRAQEHAELKARHAVAQARRDSTTKRPRYALHRATGRRGERVNQTLTRVLVTLYMLYDYGEAPTRKDLTEVLATVQTPLTGLPADTFDPNLTAEAMPYMRLDALQVALKDSTLSELEQARADFRVFMQFVEDKVYKPYGVTEPEHNVAIRLTGMVLLRRGLGDQELDDVIRRLSVDSDLG
jgi:hypothetical protein